MNGTRTRLGTATTVALALGLIAACGTGDDSPSAGDDTGDGASEDVTISVSNLPPTTEEGAREAFLARVEEFEERHPHITVEPNEYEWDATTFAAQLAGGTLPTAFQFPFTDGQSLIQRGQVADITAEVEELSYAGDFNPSVLDVVQDDAGQIYGIPIAAYGIGLHYNRTLFEEAGLDPDEPPQSWDEVREYARIIAEETGQAGYAQMTQDNTGGWMLTTLTYALGGRMQEGGADDVDVTIDNPQTRRALEMLHAMRWDDDSMGEDFLYDWGTINQAFAAGQIGMYMGGSDVYDSLVTENDIDPDDYGLTVLPLDGADAGVLGGGSIVGVRPDASAAEREAAVAWVDFYYMSKLTDEDAAVADAETLVESGSPVGTPALPIFDAEQLAQAEEWVADYVNVPLDQMRPFRDQILDQPLVPEPPVKAQELYAELDGVVQAVLTEEDADIEQLLQEADANVTALVGAG
ncbi:extracellular solute-binding protein [Actinobacteria bacterium YIM 96077]|uniref:Sugar ABC transporter substrate-binding protein n=1 Tax=Phytoactinopolyspora halophila TaxID=1981511 RepID=A0A329QJG8_9ACTN|nr:extracellular solute-binding protein [Phytoactinopolyspora halophila]AYY15329.1 extracellular solute-binding protein [Actinobacteria bacterium YIM 96077]RAW12587.1 sugar ABC transporter substrate-binding protein [Phytoactinopolyspora halophila]